MLIRVLLAIESRSLLGRIGRLLDQPNVMVLPAPRRGGLWEGLGRESCDLVVADRGDLGASPADAVAAVRKLPDRPEIIVLQEQEEPEERAGLLAAGCYAVVSANLADAILGPTLRALIQRRRESLIHRLRAERPEVRFQLSDFASESPRMQSLLEVARRVAAADSTLLILGETGVGKEWLARAIHAEGLRAAAPLIAVNCAAVPDTLLESELFGHEKGAFTGAVRARRGHFELAHRGTLFLDEIADMSPHLQAKLLRVLQDRRIQRVGGEQPIEVDVRLMAATNQDLEQAMAAKVFRRDLYYRLSVVTLTVPPLRQRREDIPALVDSYLERFRLQIGRPVAGVSEEALAALVEYSWPGNVRELINVVERAVLLGQGGEIGLADLPETIGRAGGAAPPAGDGSGMLPAGWLDLPLREARARVVEEVERRYLAEQLARAGGRIGDTARRAGLDPRSLYAKMKQLGLRKEDFKSAA